MKTQIATLTLFTLIIAACSKSSDPAPALTSATPFATYLEKNPNLTLETITGSYSLGYEFKLKGKAKVAGLGVSAPHAGTFKVQLYKVDSVNNTGTLVAEADVTVSDDDVTNKKFAFKALATATDLPIGEYYRVAYSEPDNAQGFYRLHPQTGHSLPVLTTSSLVSMTRGVYGDINAYPDQSWDVMYTADLKLQY